MMPLHVNVIAGERLLKRWHLSQPELLLMKLNHELTTVHKERNVDGWTEDYEDDLVRMVVKEKQEISGFTFHLPDVLALEEKYPELPSKIRKVMSGKDLMRRWDYDDAELLDIIETYAFGATDPVGVSVDYSHLELLLSAGCITVDDLLFKVDDVEQFEKVHGIKPKDKTIGLPRKPKHDALSKQRCREIAARIWKKDPTITIQAISGMQEIIDASKRQDGSSYLDKTIRDWINDGDAVNLLTSRSSPPLAAHYRLALVRLGWPRFYAFPPQICFCAPPPFPFPYRAAASFTLDQVPRVPGSTGIFDKHGAG